MTQKRFAHFFRRVVWLLRVLQIEYFCPDLAPPLVRSAISLMNLGLIIRCCALMQLTRSWHRPSALALLMLLSCSVRSRWLPVCNG